LLQQAIERDPTNAQAHSELANIYAYSIYTFSPLGEDPTIPALVHIERVLENGDGDALVHAGAAKVYLACGRHALAEHQADIALATNPNDFEVLMTCGFVKAYSGEPEEGAKILEEALRHDPAAGYFELEEFAATRFNLGDYEGALDLYLRHEQPPVHTYTHIAACYVQLCRIDEAKAAAARFRELAPEGYDFEGYAAVHERLCKRKDDADRWMQGYREAGLLSQTA